MMKDNLLGVRAHTRDLCVVNKLNGVAGTCVLSYGIAANQRNCTAAG